MRASCTSTGVQTTTCSLARIYACAPRERWSLGAASCAMAYESPMIFVNLTVNMDAAASPAAVLHRGAHAADRARGHSRDDLAHTRPHWWAGDSRPHRCAPGWWPHPLNDRWVVVHLDARERLDRAA